jgi:hypothetical protein
LLFVGLSADTEYNECKNITQKVELQKGDHLLSLTRSEIKSIK